MGFLKGNNGPTIVHINAIDTINRRASGMWADGSECGNIIDTRYHVGAVQITPAVGETWAVEPVGDGTWRLVNQLPIDTPHLSGLTVPTPGQTQIGSSGPIELHGSGVNVYSPIKLYAPTTLPDAADAGEGALIYDAGHLKVSDGTTWQISGAGGGGGSVGVAGQSVFGEVPSGVQDGSNLTMTTSQTFVANSTVVFRNGLREMLNQGYTESAPNHIIFTTAPLPSDVVIVDYLGTVAATGAAVFGEIPSGVKDGSNLTFTLAHAFVPGSISLYRNSLREPPTTSYTESPPMTINLTTPALASDDLTVDYLISA